MRRGDFGGGLRRLVSKTLNVSLSVALLAWEVDVKKVVVWMPAAILLGSCAASPLPLPPHMKFDEAVSKYGSPSHVDSLSHGGSIAVFQRKVGSASMTSVTLTFDAGGQCLDAKVETKTSGSDGPSVSDNLDEITRLKNECYSHVFDAH